MKNIPFKAVAVDMDGTFVRLDNTYDHHRFRRILDKLKANHIHFIVASGRPIDRLRIDFHDFIDEIDLIADNGSILVQDNTIINSHYLTYQTGIRLINFIKKNFPGSSIMISSFENGYLDAHSSAEFKKFMNFYYQNLISMDNLTQLPSSVRMDKLTIWTDASAEEVEKGFNNEYSERIRATSSGFNCMDIIPYSVNKANALQHFLRYFNVKPDQLIAFGDGMNDYEMLKLAGLSYAMANADPELKKIAKYEAPSNQEDGVLQVLEQYLY